MPKIPMAEKAGMLRHVSDTVHMQGAPPLNWKLDEGQALIDMGDKIGRGAERLGGALMAFGEHMQHQEDVLAATEDRNLFAKLNGELENKLANTPGATDEQKKEWITGYKQMYEDQRKPFLDRMSGRFRRQHDAEMNGLRIKAQNSRNYILTQGKVQRATDLTLSLLKDAGLRGDGKEYRRILDEAQQGEYPLFSAEMRAKLELNFNHLADSGRAKALVEADPAGALEQLKARDSEGNYANFKGLEESRRDALLRAAEAEQGRREREMDLQVVEEFRNGTALYTKETFDDWLSRGEITGGQYTRYMQYLRESEARESREDDQRFLKTLRDGETVTKQDLDRDLENGSMTIEQYNRRLHWIQGADAEKAREEAYRASQKEKAEKAVRQQQADRFLNETLYDENGYARTLTQNDLARAAKRAQEICGKDPDLYGDLLRKLNSALEKNIAYRDTPLYKDGEILIAGMRAQGKIWVDGEHWYNRDDKSSGTVQHVEKLLRIDLENFVQDHPQANQTELKQHLEDRLKIYQEHSLSKIADLVWRERGMRGAGQRIEKENGGKTSGTYNGRRVIKKNGKWYYAE